MPQVVVSSTAFNEPHVLFSPSIKSQFRTEWRKTHGPVLFVSQCFIRIRKKWMQAFYISVSKEKTLQC